jgi:GNAT superfamily N-acetyltransferase
MTMGFHIRTAAPEDALAACGVLRRSILECCQQDHHNDRTVLEAWLGNKTPHNVGNWMASPSNHMLVAERDGELVGVALLTQAGKLSLCYVLPEAQHSGVGKALLAGAEAKALEWGIGVLSLKSTSAACGFYARNGFTNAGKEKTCYGLECDFFWKKLNAAPGADSASSKRFCGCSGQ